MILKTILVDDEILNLKNLELILHRNFQEIEIIGKFQNVADAKIFIQKNPFDLLFLDISMPLESGFDLLNYFPQRNFHVIFVTAHDEYAINAIRAGAVDYVLKPILISELKNAINRVKATVNAQSNPQDKTIVLNYEGGKSIVIVDEIEYLQGLDNLTMLFLTNNRKLVVSKTLKHFEESLPSDFFRIHKSFLVNLKYVSKIVSRETLFLELIDRTQLPISRRNYSALNTILNK